MQQIQSLLKQAPAFAQIGRRFRFQDELNLLREIFHAVDLQRERHAPARAHRVDGDRKLRRLAVDRRLFEEQRLPATGRFHLAIRPFRDQQIGIDRNRDALQFARLIQRVDELPEGGISHLATAAAASPLVKPRRRQKLERDRAPILERNGALRIADNVGVIVEKGIVKRVVKIVSIAKSTAPSAIQAETWAVSVARSVKERPSVITRGRCIVNPRLHDLTAIPSRHPVAGRSPRDIDRVLRHAFANFSLLDERLIGRRQSGIAAGRSSMRVSVVVQPLRKRSETRAPKQRLRNVATLHSES